MLFKLHQVRLILSQSLFSAHSGCNAETAPRKALGLGNVILANILYDFVQIIVLCKIKEISSRRHPVVNDRFKHERVKTQLKGNICRGATSFAHDKSSIMETSFDG